MSNPTRALWLRKVLFAALLLLICVLVIHWITEENKPWIVPPEYKSLKNPLTPSESNLNAARRIYAEECAQCHGDHGKGDGPEARSHYPLPADLTDPKLLTNVTDGEIFYQISEGRRPMPSFKRRLTENQRWQLVLLVRSFLNPLHLPASSPHEASLPTELERAGPFDCARGKQTLPLQPFPLRSKPTSARATRMFQRAPSCTPARQRNA